MMNYIRFSLRKDQKVTKGVFKLLQSVDFLAPDVSEGDVLEVRVLAKAGRYEEAKTKARGMIDWAYSRKRKRYLEKLLADVEEDERTGIMAQ